MTSANKPRLALDLYVLAQGIKTGVYRVCDELFPRLAQSPRFNPRYVMRKGFETNASKYLASHRMPGSLHTAPEQQPSDDADILLSPFGVAPQAWLNDPKILHAHIIYDLIAIRRPDFFTLEASTEVNNIVASLDEYSVIFAISEFTKKDLLAYRPDLKPSQVMVIPLAAGDNFKPCHSKAKKNEVRERYGIPANVPYVLSLATLEIRKNLDQVVESFMRHLDQHEGSRLHLVLSGMSGWKLDQLNQALAAAGNWRDRIILTGFVEDEDLSALYSDAMCFVYLSRYEGFGLPPLEAMACGTPVICANNSSLPEVVGQAGLMFDADDVDGVAQAIQNIISSDQYRAELSAMEIERAKLFSWDQCASIVADTLCESHDLHVDQPTQYQRKSSRSVASLNTPVISSRTFVQKVKGKIKHLLSSKHQSDKNSMTQSASSAKQQIVGRIAQASFAGYENGSIGPHFARASAGTEHSRQPPWPVWADSLPLTAGSSRVEGGLRTQGRYKSGTPEMPLVTYVTVVRNNTATLERTIENVQRQVYPNVEHIVLDGASTDGTLDIILRHAHQLDYFASEPDGGLYDAINKAVPLARGQLICILNSDDWLEPNAAEIAVRHMKARDVNSLLLTAAKVRDGEVIHEWHPAFVHPGSYFMCANDCHNGIYATRMAYERSGPYDSSYKIAADFKWIMSCLDTGASFTYTKEATVNYSLDGISSNFLKHSLECMRVVQERFPFLTSSEVRALYHCFFVFSSATTPYGVDRPANFTAFLRDLFARQGSNPDFLSALGWAAIVKLDHPADRHRIAHRVDSSSIKEIVKKRLTRYPGLYRLAHRLYLRLFKS